MQPTPRLRVLSERIPRVLVFVYFCRGLSGNMEERSTCRVYIEILMCRATSRRLQKPREWTGRRSGPGAGRPPSPVGCPPWVRIQSGPVSRIMLHRPKGSRITVQSMSVWSNGSRSLEGTTKPDPLAPGGDKFIIELRGALEGIPLL